jgi:3-hydroxyacyl-CoA dehydrogenase
MPARVCQAVFIVHHCRSGKRSSGKLLFDMRAASAWLLDDETVVLRLQAPANTINIQVIAAVQRSLTEAEQRSSALLLMNAGEDFSLGANLPLLTAWACGGHFQRIRELVDAFQRLTLRMMRSRVPIVCHAFGRVLGGGAELCLASTEVLAEPSARAGLVEVQLGVIPGGGGSVLLLRNELAGLMLSAERERASRMVFDWIFTAHVASCAQEARNIGLLPPTTLILPQRADAFERARARVARTAARV